MNKQLYINEFEDIIYNIIKNEDIELLDTEFVEENGTNYLRAFFDKSGGMTIDDCARLSELISKKLDEKDFIEEQYILEISSKDLSRPLVKDSDFKRNIGNIVEINTYKKINNEKYFIGELMGYNDENITIKKQDDNSDNILEIPRKAINIIRIYIKI